MAIISGLMEREVFIMSNGKSFSAWDVQFSMPQQHVETNPVSHYEPDGKISRHGKIHRTVETSQVRFCAYTGSLAVGQKGQLSAMGDQFFGVTVSAVEAAGSHELVRGQASRDIDFKLEWDP